MSKKTNFEKTFEDVFNLPETKVTREVEVLRPSVKGNDDIETDYKYARENLYTVIERGSDALNSLVDIAQQSESPRAYEVVSQLIKTLGDANKDLLEVQKKVKSLKQEEISKGPNNVTNALFVGNTAELQKLLKDKNNESSE